MLNNQAKIQSRKSDIVLDREVVRDRKVASDQEVVSDQEVASDREVANDRDQENVVLHPVIDHLKRKGLLKLFFICFIVLSYYLQFVKSLH